jgi:tetratricopeptide (TPR) repeat protein
MAKGIEVGSALTSFARAAGDGQILGDALCQYAFALLAAGDYRAADVPLREAQAIEGLSPRLRLSLLQYRALLSTSTGDFDAAARILGQVIEQWRSVGDKGNEALSMQQLANVEFERSAYHRAIDLMHRSIALQRQVGSSGNLGFFLCTLGSMLALDGEFDAAIPPAIEAIMIWASRDPRHMDATLTMELLAYITAANGDLVRAARLTAYTDAARARMGLNHDGIARAVYDRLAALLREQLTPDDLARLTAEGAALSPKDAIALACLIEGTPQPTSS